MVERFEDVYAFNVEGNFEAQLEALRTEVANSRKAWKELRVDLTRGADVFRKVEKAAKGAAKGQADAATSAKDLRPEMERISGSAEIAALAYNSLVRAQNRLNVSRAAELQALRQLSSKQQPNIIALRAEERALRTLTKALEEDAFQRKLRNLAAEAGITLTADGAKVFDAEAIAAERAAKAVQTLAVAEALRSKGLDLKGKPLPVQDTLQGPGLSGLTIGQEQAAKERAALLDNKARFDEHVKTLRQYKTAAERAAEASKAGAREMVGTAVAGEKTRGVISNLLYTFRRLIGVLALFTVARRVTAAFNSMIVGAIQFNSQLERNRVGMAGLIAASGQVLDAQGKRIPIEQQLTAAQDLSIVQMRELRKDAIKTVATFEDLSEALSQAIAPGIGAGLDLATIREITVSISQAAAGLGVAQNQLSEEIRALFQGTITPRNTRIATALGITNEDIRRAKELGQLGTFLKNRFDAISKSGAQLANTFAGQVNAAQDAFKQLVAETSKPLFEQLKAGLRDFNQQIFVDLDKNPVINEDALKVFNQLFIGIAQGVRNIRAAFDDLDIQGFADTFGLIGRSIGVVGTVLAVALSSAFKVAAPLLTIFNSLVSALNTAFLVLKRLDKASEGILSSLGFGVIRALLLVAAFRKAVAIAKGLRDMWLAIKAAMLGSAFVATVLQAKISGVVKLVAGIRANFISLSRTTALIAAALILLDNALRFFGLKGGLIGLVGDAFVYLNEQVDKLIDNWSGLNAEAEKTSLDAPGVIADGFKNVQEQVQQLSQQIRNDLVRSTAAFSDEIKALTLTPAGADQVRELSNIFLESAKAYSDAKAALQKSISDQQAAQKAAPFIVDILAVKKQIKDYEDLNEQINRLQAFRTVNFPAPEFVRPEDVGRLREINSELLALSRKRAEAETSYLLAKDKAAKLDKQAIDAEAALNKSLVEQESLQKILREIETERLQKQAASLKILSAQRVAQIQTDLPNTEIDAIRERAVTDLLKQGDEQRIPVVESLVALRKEEIAALDQQSRRQQDIRVSQERLEALGAINADWAKAGADAEERQLAALRLQDEALTKLEKARIDRLAEEARLAKLRDSGGIGDGFDETIKKLASEKDNMFFIGENLARGLFEGLPQTLGSIVATSLRDGFNSAEALEAFRGLLINSIAQFVQDLVTNLLANIFTQATKAADNAAVIASLTAVNATTLTVSAAAQQAAVKIGASLVSGGVAVGIAAGTLLLAAAALKSALGPFSGVASFFGKAEGGKIWKDHSRNVSGVQGFARGGSTIRRSRPAGIDPRDTIPAFLRPGEWVIRPEAVRHYGDRLFAMLNGRKINRSALTGIRSMGSSTKSPRVPRSSYATGGPVSSRGSAPSSATQLVLQFHDEQTMDRALAAGSDSMVRFTRTRRSAIRSALGLDRN